ncbi:hypothetical protein P5673_019881 [Acropora cervicornis]|uniref:Uncharacterized protein n=1 Tax=Acropora cervicornis TaxID=6130 RepID=A0AAD9V1L4_ACRCE|nr:hypothetical protein P5673_019881 [Acropora cervicornis]
MYGTVDKQVEIYKVPLKSDAIDDFEMELQCINTEKPVLTYLPNPRIPELKLKNSRIRRLVFSDEAATAEKLPIHGILELVPEVPMGKVIHYNPHQPVIPDQAESTKMRIVAKPRHPGGPYILGATFQKHVNQYAEKYPATTDEMLKNTYADDVQSGGRQKEELLTFKEEAIKIMAEGGFQLQKWHINIPKVEAPLSASGNALASTVSPAYGKILEVPWSKTENRLKVGFMKQMKEANDNKLTKRKMLSTINGIFDLLRISAPVIVTGKVLYSQVCLRKLRWDEE